MFAPANAAIKVALLDDFAVVRQGIRALLERQPEIQIVADLPLESAVTLQASGAEPDVVVVEPETLSHREVAHDVVSTVCAILPYARVLILTAIRDPEEYTRFLVHGALGLVLKHQPGDVLVKAIRKVNEGEVWLDRGSTAQLLHAAKLRQRGDWEVERKIDALTRREREIIAHICAGARNVDLAERLFISEATVRNHV